MAPFTRWVAGCDDVSCYSCWLILIAIVFALLGVRESESLNDRSTTAVESSTYVSAQAAGLRHTLHSTGFAGAATMAAP